MPPSFASFIDSWKDVQRQNGYAEKDDLVLAHEDGRPFCPSTVTREFKELLVGIDLPALHFHSLRYSSTSYKLILSKGDIKAVQGDNGHAQPKMVLSIYSLIQEDQRIKLAKEMEVNFCSKSDFLSTIS